ncbi:shikimate kinase [Paenibacillus physcomitrellae]|uniref:shikimate kinase n=1 Tax=Paenibacillus physcomitrellae TaxID=1619311 RepID=UPI000B8CAFBC|nr:shikimate kinase [Paenibacillus physcomitrellae]
MLTAEGRCVILPEQENWILIGMMGTGKSTVAELLAHKTGRKLVDLDAEIVKAAGCPIPEIFERQGEAAFRQLESVVLARILEDKPVILATGGGAVLNPDNCRLMLDKGWVVALKADADTILRRVGEDSNRPLLAGGARERILRLLEERKNAYDFAHCTVDTFALEPEQVAAHILMLQRV